MGLTMSSPMDYVKMVLQVGFLAWVFYQFYEAVVQTKAQQIVRVIVTYAALYAVSYTLRLSVLTWVLRGVFIPLWVFICIIYQPEIRRAFSQLWSGHGRLFHLGGQTTTSDQLDSVLNACNVLVNKKRGALIVFPRRMGIKNIIDTGTRWTRISPPL
jgi:diadenylate cyclase